jgi:hypothetical protein
MLRRYPVKSLLGEEVAASDVTRAGLAGDRRLALVSRETGKIASAKYPRLWRDMLTLSATAVDDTAGDDTAGDDTAGDDTAGDDTAGDDTVVRIMLPDGKAIWSTDADADAVLSDTLGQPVRLTGTPPPGGWLDRAVPEAVLRDGVHAEVPSERSGIAEGTFFDFAAVHLLTTATLDRIAELSPYRRASLERYRPNVVIRTEAAGFTENDWLDRDLRIGEDLVLRVIARTPRCAIPTLAHGPLPRDADALRIPARHNRVTALPGRTPEPCAGVYADVLTPGRIRTGDPVQLT